MKKKFVLKLWLIIIGLVGLMAVAYAAITTHFQRSLQTQVQQELHATLAQDLVDEKFKDDVPFNADGSVNKAFFGDLMHNMMAINRTIEIYLLDESGRILYSVVLDPKENDAAQLVPLEPIQQFINRENGEVIKGVDPTDPGNKKIFSAAPYSTDLGDGYVYIILEGNKLASVNASILDTELATFTLWLLVITSLFIMAIGLGAVTLVTRNLRRMTAVITDFRDGDLQARILNPSESDFPVYAQAFNEMANTITSNLEELKGVDELRRNLIANVSHDLRTPLAIIRGYAETVKDSLQDLPLEKQHKYLSIIESNSQKLTGLVEQLFEYSKLEARQIQPHKEHFSISDLAQDIIVKYELLAKEKSIDLKLNKAQENIMAHADVALMERAIENLLQNAIKYTQEHGEVVIDIQQIGTDCKVSVIDNGAGIEEEFQKSIFARFQTAPSSRGQGTGIGLAIVQKIMELHDTTIELVSRKQQGSTFSFMLPA
ncbi:sensor histidine kinase [Nonlabens ponticola]|uniref:histidine kinase n=1 Tax=Nonlabens ponticola TaxID=2496866 RepID=A0A3S9MVV0_9FLAO|nr:HAMP domain-containing sensor histidine kinase [Nonlabens ponticola]AZQ43341.1 sensor histidine kinase [Nonlabens ponticola]